MVKAIATQAAIVCVRFQQVRGFVGVVRGVDTASELAGLGTPVGLEGEAGREAGDDVDRRAEVVEEGVFTC